MIDARAIVVALADVWSVEAEHEPQDFPSMLARLGVSNPVPAARELERMAGRIIREPMVRGDTLKATQLGLQLGLLIGVRVMRGDLDGPMPSPDELGITDLGEIEETFGKIAARLHDEDALLGDDIDRAAATGIAQGFTIGYHAAKTG